MKKKRKIYVAIALLAIAGLVLTSLTGAFAGLFAGSGPTPPRTENIDEYLRYYGELIAALEKDLEKDPENAAKLEELASIYYQVSYLYSMLGDYLNSMINASMAFWTYQEVMKLTPDDIELLLTAAMTGINAGIFPETEEIYRDILTRDPRHPVAHLHYGYLLIHMEDFEGAIEKWEALLAMEEDFDPGKYKGITDAIFVTAADLIQDAKRHLEESHVHDENCDHEDDEEGSEPPPGS